MGEVISLGGQKTHNIAIDRAARALLRSRWPDAHWDSLGEESRDKLRKHVRAVIEAIREPDDRMITLGDEVMQGRYGCSFEVRPIYTEMIDALLAE